MLDYFLIYLIVGASLLPAGIYYNRRALLKHYWSMPKKRRDTVVVIAFTLCVVSWPFILWLNWAYPNKE